MPHRVYDVQVGRWLLLCCALLIASPALAGARTLVAALPTCTSVAVAGGDYNGGGGTIYAQMLVKNIGRNPCAVRGHPLLRLASLRVPVTVAEIAAGANAGAAAVTLRPGQTARAVVLVVPGSCDRSRSTTTGLRASASWRQHPVKVSGSVCRNGSGRVLVGGFAASRH